MDRHGLGGYLPVLVAALLGLAVTTALVIAGRKGERRVEVRYSRLGGRRPGAELRYLPLVLSHRGFVPAVVAALLLAPLRLPALPYLTLLFLLGAAGACLAVRAGRSVLTDPDLHLRTRVYLPGVEPGAATVEHVAALRRRLAVAEALGTGLVAVLPALALAAVGVGVGEGYAFGGASVLMVAGAAIDAVGSVMQDVQRRRAMRDYAMRNYAR